MKFLLQLVLWAGSAGLKMLEIDKGETRFPILYSIDFMGSKNDVTLTKKVKLCEGML